MIRIFFIYLLFISYLFAATSGINDKKDDINKNIKQLAKKIINEEKTYKNITKQIVEMDSKLSLNKSKLEKATNKLVILKDELNDLEIKKQHIEVNVIKFVSKRYSMSMGLDQANKKNLNSIIDKEVYSLIFQNAKKEIVLLNEQYIKVNKSIDENITTTNKLNEFIQEQKEIQFKNITMKEKQKETIESLKNKHQEYTKNLKTTVKNQHKVTKILSNLSIVKNKKIKNKTSKQKKVINKITKKKIVKKKESNPNNSSKQIASTSKKALKKDLKKIGTLAKNVKVTNYVGAKTSAPLKSYIITKKFGKYHDDVYNMELFNKSISLKTKKQNAKVMSVFKGKVVYAKKSTGYLKNVVIVQHSGKLYTIYSHLDKISPTIKVGKWILKGYVVGRVSDTLVFQATKGNNYINPLELIK